MKLQTIAFQLSFHLSERLLNKPKNDCLEFQRIKNLIKNNRSRIIDGKVTENCEESQHNSNSHANCNDRDCTCLCECCGSSRILPPETIKSNSIALETQLCGPNQTMTKEGYTMHFAEFINCQNPRELMRATLCDIPEKMFLDMTAFEQQDFIHKLGNCVQIFKVYQQSAEFNHRNKVETLELDEQVELRKKDQKFKVKPSEEENQKKRKETQQEKLVKQLRDCGFSEEKILEMVHGKK